MKHSDWNIHVENVFLRKQSLYQEVIDELHQLRELRYSPFLISKIKDLYEKDGLVTAVKYAKNELRISLREAKQFTDSLAETNQWKKATL